MLRSARARTTLDISSATVTGPTPPGTGVNAAAQPSSEAASASLHRPNAALRRGVGDAREADVHYRGPFGHDLPVEQPGSARAGKDRSSAGEGAREVGGARVRDGDGRVHPFLATREAQGEREADGLGTADDDDPLPGDGKPVVPSDREGRLGDRWDMRGVLRNESPQVRRADSVDVLLGPELGYGAKEVERCGQRMFQEHRIHRRVAVQRPHAGDECVGPIGRGERFVPKADAHRLGGPGPAVEDRIGRDWKPPGAR